LLTDFGLRDPFVGVMKGVLYGLPDDRSRRHTVVGRPFAEIVRFGKEQQIDLIVIGSHGRRGISHLLLGSVAERVVRLAGCPVLTVRPDQHQFVTT
jgi:nucleotide-binding universal stress UspA family protein